MAEEKVQKESKIAKIRARLAEGWTDTKKIAEDTGAAVGTVGVQKNRFYKENPSKKPKKEPKKESKKESKKAE